MQRRIMPRNTDTQPILEQLMQSQKYSDLVLLCQGEEFKVHKAIVCTQSPVLAAACDGGFKETVSNVIRVEEFDVETVRRMVKFMYTHIYCDVPLIESDGESDEQLVLSDFPGSETPPSAQSPEPGAVSETDHEKKLEDSITLRANVLKALLSHVKMNAIADYYDLPELRLRANEKIKHILDTFWFPRDFPVVIREAFNSTGDEELFSILSKAMAAHVDELDGPAEEIAPPDLVSDFAMSVFRNMAAEMKSLRETYADLLECLQGRLSVVEAKLESSKAETNRERASLKSLEFKIYRFRELLLTTNECRNCGLAFGCYMDSDLSILRCERCRCRHIAPCTL